MKIERKEQTAQMSQDIVQNNVGVKADSVGFMINLMSTKLYKDPRMAFLREILSNAIDSNAEAGVENPVLLRIYLDQNSDFHIQIRDYGVGLSVERFEEVYINIASSTKRDDNQQQGGFGIGRFSALSYAQYAAVTSFYKGIRYDYAMYHDGDSTSIPKLNETPTDEPNGVLVDIAFNNITDFSKESTFANNAEIFEILGALMTKLSYMNNIFVEFDVEKNEKLRIKHEKIYYNFEKYQFAVDRINDNIIVNKESYIFSRNAFINGINSSPNDCVFLESNNYEGSDYLEGPNNCLHIVVGENVHYPLDFDKLNSGIQDYILRITSQIKGLELLLEEKYPLTPEQQEELTYLKRTLNYLNSNSYRNHIKEVYKLPIGIKVPIGVLDILPNREEFIYNKATVNRLLDIIIHKFLPEFELEILNNNIQNFENYESFIEYYKDFNTYTHYGNFDNFLMYLNREAKIAIHINYNTLFESLQAGGIYKIYKTELKDKFSWSTQYNNLQRQYSKTRFAIQIENQKNYRFFYLNKRKGYSKVNTHFFFLTINNQQVNREVLNLLVKFNVKKEVFLESPADLENSPLFDYNTHQVGSLQVDNFFRGGNTLAGSVTHLGRDGKITKRFSSSANHTVSGYLGSNRISNIIKGSLDKRSMCNVFADIESLTVIQKEYLIQQVSEYHFKIDAFKQSYDNSLSFAHSIDKNDPIRSNYFGLAGLSDNNRSYGHICDVNYLTKEHLLTKKEFLNKVYSVISEVISSNYEENSGYSLTPEDLMKRMVENMKKYQAIQVIKKDAVLRREKVNIKFNDLIREQRYVVDKYVYLIKELELKFASLEKQVQFYERPITKGKQISGGLWNSHTEEDWEKVHFVPDDYTPENLALIKSQVKDLQSLKTKANVTIGKLEKQLESILRFITEKYYTKVIKAKGLSNFKSNPSIWREVLVNRKSIYFKLPDEVRLLRELMLEYYSNTYDLVINNLFVDFTDVTDVSEEFETEFLAKKAKLRENLKTDEKIVIKQLIPNRSTSKGYGYNSYKEKPEDFIEKAFSGPFNYPMANKQSLYNKQVVQNLKDHVIFVYGSSTLSKKTTSNSPFTPLVSMFLTFNSLFEQYRTNEEVSRHISSLVNSKQTNVMQKSHIIFLDIASANHKYFKNLHNFIHIDDFMQNLSNYRQIRRMNTVLFLEQEATGLIQFSKVVKENNHIFREVFSNKLVRLAEFMERYSTKLTSGTKQQLEAFRKELLVKAQEDNMFDQNIIDLYNSCKKELKDMPIVLSCTQQNVERTFFSEQLATSDGKKSNREYLKAFTPWKLHDTANRYSILQGGRISTGGSYSLNEINKTTIHPLMIDFLVKTLKERKNIIPTYQACNQVIINSNL